MTKDGREAFSNIFASPETVRGSQGTEVNQIVEYVVLFLMSLHGC